MTYIENQAENGLFDPKGYSTKEAKKNEEYALKNREQEGKVWDTVEMSQGADARVAQRRKEQGRDSRRGP